LFTAAIAIPAIPIPDARCAALLDTNSSIPSSSTKLLNQYIYQRCENEEKKKQKKKQIYQLPFLPSSNNASGFSLHKQPSLESVGSWPSESRRASFDQQTCRREVIRF
jgi:hypothetical protein